jgi:adenylosuccinate lyase
MRTTPECHNAGMIPRYSLPEMSLVWSEERKLAVWKDVEAFVVEAWADRGVAPREAAISALNAPVPTPREVAEREAVTDHDMAAFVDLLAASSETGGEWIHFGLTSSDVLDTAAGVIMRDAADLLLARLDDLIGAVTARAVEHRHTPAIGRTHGIWAEPTSFGLKLATWVFELRRDRVRMAAARETVAVGKISGAVGTYAHCPPEIEASVCSRLGLSIEPASTQVTARDRHAEFLQAIALTGASIERFATEIRHLQRSEVREVRESFGSGQKGSSAMPHKRNPIMSERMTGMARLLRGYSQTALENVALWHERDISHSSAERVIIPDACLALHYMLVKFTALVTNLVIDTERMAANLDSTKGLVFSQAVLLELIETGMTRDEAYRIVQRSAMRAWDEGTHLRDLLAADPEVTLDADTLDACFRPERFLRHIDAIFERLRHVEGRT